MGQRSRKRGRREKPATAPPVTAAAPRRVSRSEERNALIRAALTPLAAGERPWAVKVSVVIAFLLGTVNLALFLSGTKPKVGGQQPHLAEILIFFGLMMMCAIGMWLMRYWAVLGFQTLLAIGLLGFSLALVRVSNLLAGAILLVVIVAGGFLFFKLVRVLSRLQLPAPPGR